MKTRKADYSLFKDSEYYLKQGYSIEKTAKILECNHKTVRKALNNYNKSIADYKQYQINPRFTEKELLQLIEKYKTASEISKALDLPYSTIIYWTNYYNINLNAGSTGIHTNIVYNLSTDSDENKVLELFNNNLNIIDIAQIMDRNVSNINYILYKNNLLTDDLAKRKLFECIKHSKKYMGIYITTTKIKCFCSKCCYSKKYLNNITKRKNNNKLKAVEKLGGKCQKCGYNKYIFNLEFHHIDKTNKQIMNETFKKKWDYIETEISKCKLLCVKCHRKEHYIENIIPCKEHKERKRGCKICHNNYMNIKRKELKNELIDILGNKCQICKNKQEKFAYEFHHIDPSLKENTISHLISGLNKNKIAKELNNLALLCCYCHREVTHNKLGYNFKNYYNL